MNSDLFSMLTSLIVVFRRRLLYTLAVIVQEVANFSPEVLFIIQDTPNGLHKVIDITWLWETVHAVSGNSEVLCYSGHYVTKPASTLGFLIY